MVVERCWKGGGAVIAEWTEAFLTAQAEFPEIPKNKTARIDTKGGGSYSYQYADLPDVLGVVRPILNANGLAVAQVLGGDAEGITVTTRIYHKSGHFEEFGPLTLPSGGTAQAAGSAVTYARRYGLAAALGIAPDEDDDGVSASHSTPRQDDSGLKCPECGGATFDNTATNEQRVADGKKPMPVYKCRDKSCGWIDWDGTTGLEKDTPEFDVADWAANAVQIFTEWDPDRRKAEWVEAIRDLFEGDQPKDPKQGQKVTDAMSKVYFAEFPDGRPF